MKLTFREKFEKWQYRRKKAKWVANLKVGDIVCDCSYRHQAIKELWAEPALNGTLLRIMFRVLPTNIALTVRDSVLDYLLDNEWDIPVLMVVYDHELVLEDGSSCSAKHCCWMPDHPWEHPK
jgi:hypothetical protein